MIRGRAAIAVEVDTQGRESSKALCGDQPALLVRGSSATTHCHAAPALPTRGYQGDDRRCFLTSAALPALAPLDKDFHIRTSPPRCSPSRWPDGATSPTANGTPCKPGPPWSSGAPASSGRWRIGSRAPRTRGGGGGPRGDWEGHPPGARGRQPPEPRCPRTPVPSGHRCAGLWPPSGSAEPRALPWRG
jgi:hypothetical protein